MRPALPASLEGGGYVGKDEGEDVGVEPVVRAAAAAGALQSGCDVLSYRNNLNKIFGVPFDPSSPWTVDACLLRLPGPAPGSGRGSSSTGRGGGGGGSMAGIESGGSSSLSGSESGGGGGGTLFLDIVKVEQAWIGDPAQMEKFTRWGYRQAAGPPLRLGCWRHHAPAAPAPVRPGTLGTGRRQPGRIPCAPATMLPPPPAAAAACRQPPVLAAAADAGLKRCARVRRWQTPPQSTAPWCAAGWPSTAS